MSDPVARAILRSELVDMLAGGEYDSTPTLAWRERTADAILRRFVVIPAPSIGHLARHETVQSRYRNAASEVRYGRRGGWGSNMQRSLADTLNAISDAMEGQG